MNRLGDFAPLLARAVKQSGTTQATLARRAGIATATLCYWIQGLKRPRRANYEALEEVLRRRGIPDEQLTQLRRMLAEHLRASLESSAHLLDLIDRRRRETGSPDLGANVERMVIERELLDVQASVEEV